MKITNVEVYGFIPALRGMRSPMNSWHLQDTDKNNVGHDDMYFTVLPKLKFNFQSSITSIASNLPML